METYFTKIKKWGNSLGIIIPALYVEEKSLQEEDLVEVKIVRSLREREIKSYRCRMCEYRFDTDEDNPQCPVCDNTKVEVLKE
jgi:antitoxin component of MazEF toxin-antitoxin module